MSDYACDCSEDMDFDAILDPCFVKEVTARRPHVCGECHEPIKPGMRYEYTKGLIDGKWETHKTCLPCVAMRDDYCPNGWFFGYLGDSIKNCLGWSPYEVPEFEEVEDG